MARTSATAANPKPGSRGYFKWYWLYGPGVKKWHDWTSLHRHLRTKVGATRAKRITSVWYKERFGIWVGEKKGQNPRGPG